MKRKDLSKERPVDVRAALIEKVKDIYGIEPDHPFKLIPDAIVFRRPDNRKWFGLVMGAPVEALGLTGNGRAAGVSDEAIEYGRGGSVDVLDIKLDPFLIDNLRRKEGYHSAYHMNKGSWITIRLDGSVPVEEILGLLDMSYELTAPKAARGARTAMRVGGLSWIIPANPANYDVAAGFEREGTLVWHVRPRVFPGDFVYIYETLPLGCILFKCEVLEADLPNEDPDHPGAQRAMRLKLLKTYEKGKYNRAFMRKHGVTNVRSARSAPLEFVRAIEEAER